MKKRSATTNDGLVRLIDFLDMMGREKHAPIWKELARRLAYSRKNRSLVNVSSVERHTNPDDVVAVPGKLLGAGAIGHAVTVAAHTFSATAREKVINAGGKCVSFEELVKNNPKGSNVRII